jgi:hypothetical protein
MVMLRRLPVVEHSAAHIEAATGTDFGARCRSYSASADLTDFPRPSIIWSILRVPQAYSL